MWSLSRSSVPLIAGAILAACTSPPDNTIIGDDDTTVPPDATPVDDAGPDVPPDAGDVTPADATPDEPPDANPAPQMLEVCATGAPFTSVSAAIAAASAGDTILVCPGTYHERVVLDGLALTLTGTGGPEVTILDGDHAGTVLAVRNTTVVVSGLAFVNGASSTQGGAVRCDDSTLTMTNSRLATSTSTGGGGGLAAFSCALDVATTAFDHNEGGPFGGGVLVQASTGSIHHGWLTDNTADAGAGIMSLEGTVALRFDEISRNAARVRGGGLYQASDAELASNAIADNTSGWTAGGIFVDGHAPLISTNEIRGNTSVNDGGGIYLDNSHAVVRANLVRDNVSGDDGGGIRSFESACTLDANVVEHNQANDGGGGIRVSHVPCLLTDNLVRDNTAGGTGGGLDLDNDASTVRGGEITGNHAGGSGGGIFTWLAPWLGTTIDGVLIQGNSAWQGGGIYAADNFKPLTLRGLRLLDNHAGRGGALMIATTTYTLSDSLIAGNNADVGAGIYHAPPKPPEEPCGGMGQLPCPPLHATGVIAQSVVFGNIGGGAQIAVADEGLTVTTTILAGFAGTALQTIQPEDPTLPSVPPPAWRYNDTLPATFEGMEPPIGHDGNLEINPAFVDAAGGDFHLDGDSVCIGAGDPQYSVAGVLPDMGLVGGAP